MEQVKELVEMLVNDYKNGECEKQYKHSDFVLYTKELCLREEELGTLEISRIDDDLDEDEDIEGDVLTFDNMNSPLAGLMWVIMKSIEDGRKIDYINDSFSIVRYEYNLFELPTIYGMTYSDMYTVHDGYWCDRLVKLVNGMVSEEELAYIHSLYKIATGYHYLSKVDHPLEELTEEILELMSAYRGAFRGTSHIHFEVVNCYRTTIEDNVLYPNDDDPDRDKVDRILKLLEKVASVCYSYGSYIALGKPLPKFIMLDLYSIMYSMVKEAGVEYEALFTGNIHELSYDDISTIEGIVNSRVATGKRGILGTEE